MRSFPRAELKMAALKGKKCVLRAFVKRDIVVFYVQILFVTGVRER